MANKVGGEVDAFCTRCKLLLSHTILAMVGTKIARVRCNTCGGDHAFRSPPSSSPSRPAAAKPAREREEKIVISFQERLGGVDLNKVPPYSPKERYAVGQVLRHPTFGYGIVNAVRDDKVQVAFKADEKTLIHGRGDTERSRPAFSAPRPAPELPSDKPTPELSESSADTPEE
jgi:hypothetical protein